MKNKMGKHSGRKMSQCSKDFGVILSDKEGQWSILNGGKNMNFC